MIASCIDPIEPEPSPYRGRPSFVIDPGGGPNDLGTLGGIRGQAQGVNSSGSIVGYSAFDSTGTVVPMIWTQASGMQRLFGPTDVTEGYAFDINDSGVVAGELLGVGGFRWESDSLYMLANISGFANSTVAAINNSGVIAGAAFDTINSTGLRPMMWDASGNPTALFPTTHSPGEAKDINNNGIVVGWISDPTLGGIAYKTDGSTVTYLYPPAGHTGGTVATVVDDSGVVYGVMNTYFGGPPNCFCAIRWDAAGNPAFLDSTYLAPK